MSNHTRTVLYIGVTNDLERRIAEHKLLQIEGFTKRYKCIALVYYEDTPSITAALEREKELKKWSRTKKNFLIQSFNPRLKDLSLHSR
jgi:putative endonuclease